MTKMRSGIVCVLVSLSILSCNKEDDLWDPSIPDTEDQPTSTEIRGYVFRPGLASASDENIGQLKVPEGFTVAKFAENLGKPRILAVSENGFVYTSDREAGSILLIKDNNSDGVADQTQEVAKIKEAHGLVIKNNLLFIAAVREIYVANINADGTLSAPQMLTDDLPDGGQHPNRTLALGPDNKLYVSIGSTCNSCPEPNELNATLTRMNPDGTGMEIFARGLRNTIGFGWHPETGELWGMDHGIDWLGDDEQKEELNMIMQNADYGWPYIYGDGKFNASDNPPGDTTYNQYLAKTSLPVLLAQAHSAPMQMAFYNGSMFPEEYQDDAFVAMRGSWNRSTAVGYSIVRIDFENGQPKSFEDFLTGFLIDNGKYHFARPVGVAVHTDGSLLISDDTNGLIYRIARTQ